MNTVPTYLHFRRNLCVLLAVFSLGTVYLAGWIMHSEAKDRHILQTQLHAATNHNNALELLNTVSSSKNIVSTLREKQTARYLDNLKHIAPEETSSIRKYIDSTSTKPLTKNEELAVVDYIKSIVTLSDSAYKAYQKQHDVLAKKWRIWFVSGGTLILLALAFSALAMRQIMRFVVEYKWLLSKHDELVSENQHLIEEIEQKQDALEREKASRIDDSKELEKQVEARTKEVVEANQQLTDEINERKRMETAVREQTMMLLQKENRLRTVINTVVDGIMTVGEKGTLTSFNPAIEKIFGYTTEELEGCSVAALIPEPLRVDKGNPINGWIKNSTRTDNGYETEALNKDGKVFPIFIASIE